MSGVEPMRILVVSQMYPGPEDPDLGSFVAQQVRVLEERGHAVELAVLDRRAGGKAPVSRAAPARACGGNARRRVGAFSRPVGQLRRTGRRAARRHRARSRRAEHRRLSRDRSSHPARRGTGLDRDCRLRVPACRARVAHPAGPREDGGDRLRRRARAVHGRAARRRSRASRVRPCRHRSPSARTSCASPRRSQRIGRGSLTFVGDGPLRGALEGRPGVRVVGRVAHDEVPGWLSAADVVCGPALLEPFGQALLEAMACSRTVVATRIGGPPEFVPPGAGILVDPLDVGALARALEAASELPRRTRRPALPRRATSSGSRRAGGGDPPASRLSRSASLSSISGPTDPRGRAPREGERLLVGLADLLFRDALLQPVVASYEEV